MYVAWRMLVHEKGRNMLAIAGIFIAVLMIFLQLGFYSSVPRGGLQVYNHFRFDILMTASSYVVQTLPFDFPRQRLYQALSLPQVSEDRDPRGRRPKANPPPGRTAGRTPGLALTDS